MHQLAGEKDTTLTFSMIWVVTPFLVVVSHVDHCEGIPSEEIAQPDYPMENFIG